MQPGPFFLPRWVVAKEAPAHSSDAHWVTRRGPTPRRRPALIGFNLSMRGWGGGEKREKAKKKPKKRSQAARSGSRAKKLTCKSPLQPHSGGRRGPSPPPHCRPRGKGERGEFLPPDTAGFGGVPGVWRGGGGDAQGDRAAPHVASRDRTGPHAVAPRNGGLLPALPHRRRRKQRKDPGGSCPR